jgi:hypothetical protein
LNSRRAGTSSLEVLMAFTLLSSVLAFSGPMIVRHNRLLRAQRDYRLALDELSNQIDRVLAIPRDEQAAAVDALGVSEATAERLPGSEIHGRIAASDEGSRLTVELTWDEPNRQAAPVRLTAWLSAEPAATSEKEEK